MFCHYLAGLYLSLLSFQRGEKNQYMGDKGGLAAQVLRARLCLPCTGSMLCCWAWPCCNLQSLLSTGFHPVLRKEQVRSLPHLSSYFCMHKSPLSFPNPQLSFSGSWEPGPPRVGLFPGLSQCLVLPPPQWQGGRVAGTCLKPSPPSVPLKEVGS